MSFQAHDRYQAHCQFCFQIFEANSAAAAVEKAEEHERDCPVNNEPKQAA
jgi:hypothetical protein